MRKANEKCDAVVAQMMAFTPEQLEQIAAIMKAAKNRASPGDQIWVQAAPGVYFYYDPKVLRGDLERSTVLAVPNLPEARQLEVLDTEQGSNV